MSPDVAALERAVDRLPNTIAAGLELISRRALGDSEDARDAVQEILARAVAAIRGGRVPPEVPLGAFVHGIAKHVIADMLRRRMRDRLADHPVESLPTHHPIAAGNTDQWRGARAGSSRTGTTVTERSRPAGRVLHARRAGTLVTRESARYRYATDTPIR